MADENVSDVTRTRHAYVASVNILVLTLTGLCLFHECEPGSKQLRAVQIRGACSVEIAKYTRRKKRLRSFFPTLSTLHSTFGHIIVN